jgi:hypothetical protein
LRRCAAGRRRQCRQCGERGKLAIPISEIGTLVEGVLIFAASLEGLRGRGDLFHRGR